jgi:hypothetical protein
MLEPLLTRLSDKYHMIAPVTAAGEIADLVRRFMLNK